MNAWSSLEKIPNKNNEAFQDEILVKQEKKKMGEEGGELERGIVLGSALGRAVGETVSNKDGVALILSEGLLEGRALGRMIG